MITNEWFSLEQDVIEAEQCLKSWLINKVADGQKALEHSAAGANRRCKGKCSGEQGFTGTCSC